MRSATWHNFNVISSQLWYEYSDPKDSRQKFNIDIKIIILQAY